MLARVHVNLLGRGGGELAEDNSRILLEGHLVVVARNVPSADHVRNQLAVTTSAMHHGFRNRAENVADGRLRVRAHHGQLVRLGKRQIDGEREAMVDLELLRQHVQIAGSYAVNPAGRADRRGSRFLRACT